MQKLLRKDLPVGAKFKYLDCTGVPSIWTYTVVDTEGFCGGADFDSRTARSNKNTAKDLWDSEVVLVDEDNEVIMVGMVMVELERLVRTECLSLPNESVLDCMLRLLKEWLNQPQKFIIWNPNSDKPPGSIMSKKQAYKVAEKMADQHSERFYVAQLLDVVEFETKEVERVVKDTVRAKKVSKP